MPFELRQQRLAGVYPSASELLTPAAFDARGTKRKRPDVEEKTAGAFIGSCYVSG